MTPTTNTRSRTTTELLAPHAAQLDAEIAARRARPELGGGSP